VNEPLLSVVTPFHNTAAYLAQCIDSVLAQTYPRFEYILVDNCSTDDSAAIAADYAQRDSRIRFIQRTQLLSQVQNYNAALTEISPTSKYCKLVQADDSIFPDCLRLMVQAFEQSESIGLVSSYYLKGNTVRGSGFPFSASWLPGKEMARMYLRTGVFVFGSPTTVMYRSSLVRNQAPFYDESLLHEDTEKCLQILKEWDFAFVHQILSFLRVGNESISTTARDFQPDALDWYILAQRYAAVFLEPEEAQALKHESRQEYYGVLARAVLHRRDSDFWEYHRKGLRSLGETIDRPYLARQVMRKLLEMASNPGSTIASALSRHGGRKRTEPRRSDAVWPQ
jgi:glycosyltransferase involved in cell wall biosynthesis